METKDIVREKLSKIRVGKDYETFLFHIKEAFNHSQTPLMLEEVLDGKVDYIVRECRNESPIILKLKVDGERLSVI